MWAEYWMALRFWQHCALVHGDMVTITSDGSGFICTENQIEKGQPKLPYNFLKTNIFIIRRVLSSKT
jgi:hypothetical protein